MTCTCLICPDCKGTGIVWYSFTGDYLGNSRCDDLDTLEICEKCGGSGTTGPICDDCETLREDND